jgi:metal transporter CNNM
MIYIILLILLILSALFSGLTIGYMSLDTHALRRKVKAGNKDVLEVYKLRKDGTQLLTTLLLGNVAINAVVSIILGEILGGVAAGFVATAVIFIACEIIPQAVMSRHALEFAARFAPLVRGLMWLFSPICYPIAWAINRFLGHELPHRISKKELISIIDEYESHLPESAIDRDEQRIARGSLMFSHRIVSDVMTPATVSIVLEVSQKLDTETITTLRSSGLSRFPVYEKERNNLIGILYWRDLVGVTIGTSVKNAFDPFIHFVKPDDTLDDVLNQFIHNRMHLFAVQDEFGNFMGVITLEDVIEEIVGTEIVDEEDKHPDLRRFARRIIQNKIAKN